LGGKLSEEITEKFLQRKFNVIFVRLLTTILKVGLEFLRFSLIGLIGRTNQNQLFKNFDKQFSLNFSRKIDFPQEACRSFDSFSNYFSQS